MNNLSKNIKLGKTSIKKYVEKYVPITIRILERRRLQALAQRGGETNRGVANDRTLVTPVSSTIGKDFKIFCNMKTNLQFCLYRCLKRVSLYNNSRFVFLQSITVFSYLLVKKDWNTFRT